MPTPSTVLVVDDDELSRQYLHGLLAAENYSVLLANSGAEALQIAARALPDLVLLDIIMEGMDGFEVCRQLRANPELFQVPIVMLTSLEGRAAQLRGLEAGADEFLHKPVDPDELLARVRTITRLNRFRQLSDERMRFEAAVAYAPDGIVLTDGEGRILHSNSAFVRLVGRPPEGILDCFRGETAALLRAQLATLDRPGRQMDTFETQLLVAAVPGTCVDVTVVRLPWSERTILEFILRDVTDRKQLEAQLFRLQRIDLLGQLAGGVVHDVNNLMTAITINAEILHATGTPEIQRRAGMIRESAERASALLRRLVPFASNANQKLKPVDLARMLHEFAPAMGKLLGDDITLEVEASPGLPAILGESTDLHQAVLNLCLNARDAMPGGGKLRLAAAAISLTPAQARVIGADATAGDFVAVSVRDTGTGIAPGILDRLFDPFFTTKPRETATGLGLAVVLRVMRRHNGFVGYETEVGAGTCFTCYFPALSGPGRA